MSTPKTKILSGVLFIALFFLAFQSKIENELPPDEAILVEEAVKEKIADFKAVRYSVCRERVLLRAEEYVDSLLLTRARFSKYDTLQKPLKLPKPLKPLIGTPAPDTSIGPLWLEQMKDMNDSLK